MTRSGILVVLLLCAGAASALPQPQLVNSCADGPGVGQFYLPVTTAVFELTEASFDLTGTGCPGTSGITDAVLCFTPQSSCSVTIHCDYTFNLAAGSGQYVTAFTGECADAPSSCEDWGYNASNSQITDLPLTAGQRTCVVCQDLEPGRLLTVSMAATKGDCGLIDTRIFADGFESGGFMSWSV